MTALFIENSYKKEKIVEKARRQNFQKAHQAAVKIASGLDARVYQHGLKGRQFSFMTKWGVTPIVAFRRRVLMRPI